MKQSRRLLIDEMRKSYRTKAGILKGDKGPEEAFAAWVLGEEYQVDFDLIGAALAARAARGAARTYREVAVLGYASMSLKDDEISQALVEGLAWLCGRTPFGKEPPSYEVDGTCLLGFAVGAQQCRSGESVAWLGGFLNSSATSRLTLFDHTLIAAAAATIGKPELAAMPDNGSIADLRCALSSRLPGVQLQDADETLALKIALGTADAEAEPSRLLAAVRLRVLDWLSHDASLLTEGKPSMDQVVRILERVPAAMRRWPWDEKDEKGSGIRWQIDNEYHVQDLLWIILSPLFPDLEDEENLPSVGHKHPRCDLGIPSLHAIIEVKFLRIATQSGFAALIEEIAADHSLYRTAGSNYDTLVPFIWDDTGSSEHHDEIKQGLAKMPGIVSPVIVSRPAKMKRPSSRMAKSPASGATSTSRPE